METQTKVGGTTKPSITPVLLRRLGLRSLLPLLVLLLGSALGQAQYTYTSTNGAITITGYTGAGGDIILPAILNGLPVTCIGLSAFSGNTKLVSVVIPPSITVLRGSAFANCSALLRVYFQGNAPVLGTGVFTNDKNTIYYLPGTSGWSSTFAGRPTALWAPAVPYAFVATGGTITLNRYTGAGGAVSIPNTIAGLPVTTLAETAFASCSSLTSVTLPANVSTIEPGALGFFTSLTAIAVDALNPNFSSGDGVLFNKDQTVLLRCPGGKTGGYTVPSSVSVIADRAFQSCTNLTSVALPESVTGIGEYAFAFCAHLANLPLPNGLTSIGIGAFHDCVSLTSAVLPDSLTSLAPWTFCNCSNLASVTLPGSITQIEDGAFDDCASLSSLALPEGLTRIGNSSFYRCTSLSGLTLPNGLASLGSEAFYSCTSLTSMTIPDGVSGIADYTFGQCSSLTNVLLGRNVTSVGNYAFGNCRLTAAAFRGNAPGVATSAFAWDDGVTTGNSQLTVYYLSGATGWGSTFGGRPTAVWDPVFTIQPPSSLAVAPGSPAVLTVAVNGKPPFTYQWRKNGLNLTDSAACTGSTTAQLSLANVSALDVADYDVVVANTGGTITSAVTRLALQVSPPLPPTLNLELAPGLPGPSTPPVARFRAGNLMVGRTYELQSAPGLTGWTPLGTFSAPQGSWTLTNVWNTADGTHRFFRLRLVP